MSDSTELNLFEQVRIQAKPLVCIIKAFRAEVGRACADPVVERALGEMQRAAVEKVVQDLPGSPIEKLVIGMQMHGDALEFELIRQSPDALDFNVTRCRYADLYQDLGEPELGHLLLCRLDFAMAKGFSPDLELTRRQTIMQGADFCDFRYRLNKRGVRAEC